jgi:hypothetical protein
MKSGLYCLEAEFFRALAHPARIAIVEQLINESNSQAAASANALASNRLTSPSIWPYYAPSK